MRFLKTTVLTGLLLYSCSTHLQQIQDFLQVPSCALPTNNSDFLEYPQLIGYKTNFADFGSKFQIFSSIFVSAKLQIQNAW